MTVISHLANNPAPYAPTTEAQLAVDLPVVAATRTQVLSLVLAPGIWLVTGSLAATNGAATAGAIEAQLALGTAAATFQGAQAAADELPALSGGSRSLALAVLATVTTGGTILLQVECANACTAKASTPTYAFPNATGIAAVRVA